MTKKDKMSVYTTKGDDGYTKLLSGEKVSKASKRIKAIGAIDELNAYLGLIRSFNICQSCKLFLKELQNDLFKISGLLACSKGKYLDRLPKLTNTDIEKIEMQIDKYESILDIPRYFVLPAGSQEVAYIHVARAVCRRAETEVVALSYESSVDPLIIKYLNRLSDYLFILARYVAKEQNIEEEYAKLR